MNYRLAPSWVLTTEHAASSYGWPVLVHVATDEPFGPREVVRLYPSFGWLPAYQAVARITAHRALEGEAQELVDRFVASGRIEGDV